MTRAARFAVAAGVLSLCVAVAAGAAPPSGDPKGLALLERIHHAYLTVPAVRISTRLGSGSFELEIVLRSGIAVAEQVDLRDSAGTTTFVARWGGPTFVRNVRRSCWRRLAASDSQSIVGLGARFPNQLLTRVKAPRRTASGLQLPVSVDGESAVFMIDAKSMLLRSIVIANATTRYVEQVRALRPSPRLAFPTRRC